MIPIIRYCRDNAIVYYEILELTPRRTTPCNFNRVTDIRCFYQDDDFSVENSCWWWPRDINFSEKAGSHHGYVERFQNHWTEKSSRSERYAINQSVAITSTVSQYTISPSISPSHASTRIHCYTHTLIYSHVHIIILSHMFIRIFRHKALKHVRTTWANSYTRETHRT